MKLSEKIVTLRKAAGWSQEELAERMEVSRQAVSRWEMGSAMPDAENLLRLSRLFEVTVDWLLQEELADLPKPPPPSGPPSDGTGQVMAYLVGLEIMVLFMQMMAAVFLRSAFFTLLCSVPFGAIVLGYWLGVKKHGENARSRAFSRRFFKLSGCLGSYFPLRMAVMPLLEWWLGQSHALLPVRESVLFVLYVAAAMLISLAVDRRYVEK